MPIYNVGIIGFSHVLRTYQKKHNKETYTRHAHNVVRRRCQQIMEQRYYERC